MIKKTTNQFAIRGTRYEINLHDNNDMSVDRVTGGRKELFRGDYFQVMDYRQRLLLDDIEKDAKSKR